jgi:MGT family glycosyltransferase
MKYLFCSLSSYGFLYPAIGIAQILQERGHEVAFVTGPTMQSLLDKVQMKRIARGPQDGLSFQVQELGNPLEIARQIRHLEYAVQTFAPDVLVGQQLTVSAIVIAERHHLPIASIGLSSYIWPTDVPSRSYMTPIYHEFIVERYTEIMLAYRFSRAMLSLPDCQASYNDTPIIGDLFLLQSVPELEDGAHHLPDRVHLVGTCEWNAPQHDPELQRWLDASADTHLPILYLQLGTTFRFPNVWDYVTEVLGAQPVHVAASVGRMSVAPSAIPDNFFVRDHLPQGQVLPYAQGVISSSTTTSVLGALSHGLPLLLIPGDGGEQTDLMIRCMQARVAIGISPMKITTETFTRKVRLLLEDAELRKNGAQMRQAFARAAGPRGAADLLEQLGIERQPVRRQREQKPA